jgi:hypothetical protein
VVPAKLQVRVAISARSRRVVAGMGRSSLRRSAPSNTGVLPVFTTCFQSAHIGCRFLGHDAAGHKPAEEATDTGS